MKEAWTQVTPSEFPWEREGLAYLKERLPDHEPFRAWANLEFIVDGTVSEVDLLVIAKKGIFLVELKGWQGRVSGDAGTWERTRPNAMHPRLEDNPYILANKKAKRLKSLLARQKALRGKRLPFIAPLIFLSDPDLRIQLSEEAQRGVTQRDDKETDDLPGVIATLVTSTAEEQRRDRAPVDRPMAKLIAAAMEQAGIRPSQKSRQVGDLQLKALLDEGTGYQDHVGVHPRFPSVEHRVRIYGADELATEEDREQLARAARREYELLSGVSHQGIVKAQSFVEHELGPALIFERDKEEIRLDHFLQRHHASLTLFDRLNLVRDLAEAVRHAHGHRLFHRALSPRSVLVVPSPTGPRRFSIINWQTGARDDVSGTALTIQGTRHPDQLVDAASSPYLAPEALTQPDADPALADVFSLGAIAYHVFCGQPPAESLPALIRILERDGALEVSAVLDGAGEYLTETVRAATQGDATRRSTMQDLLDGIALIEDEITAPPEAPEETPPERASPGDLLGGWTVKRRLGRGSTALAFLVAGQDGPDRVVKVANDPERNERLRDEGEVLAKLRHPAVIELHGEPIDVADRTALVLEYASEGTLAQQLERQGALSLGNLQDWGEDLLSAVAYLEQEGIPHRDIKPENCGVAERGKSRKRRLVLLDFSLARAGADQLEAGTRPYLDPFLGSGTRRRWDVAADRFSAAMVLHEMATGTTPFWSAPGVDPRMAKDTEVSIERDALPREIATPLGDFLERALRREASERFDTADDMLRAWRLLFDRLEAAHAGEAATVDAEQLRANATPTTSITAIGLSARAVDASERLGVVSVADLFRIGPREINSLRGVGVDTRRELVGARSDLRRHLELPTVTTTQDDETPDVQGLDELVAQLVPKATRRTSSQVDGLRRLLTLDPIDIDAQWPSQTDVAASLEVTRARTQQIHTVGKERWRRLPAVTRLRDELVAALERLGGLAAVDELERSVAAERGANDPEQALTLARAAVRAAIEAELAAREEPRLAYRRSGSRVLVAKAGEDRAADQRALDYVIRLGEAADELAAADTLPATTEVRTALRAVEVPEGLEPLGPERLVTLAAAASRHAAPSARLELHPRGMDPERTLRAGRGALLGADALTVEELQRRVAARFPEAAPLPDRPALDRLLAGAGLDLTWNGTRYEAPRRPILTDLTTRLSSESRMPTAGLTRLPSPADPRLVAAQDFEARLQHSAKDGGVLVLLAQPDKVEETAEQLERFPVTLFDLDALVLQALRRSCEELIVSWDRVLAADTPGGEHWGRLTSLMAKAIPQVEEQLAATPGTVALRHLGTLSRYGHLTLLDRLRDRLRGSDQISGLWLLLGADGQRSRPVLDGHPLTVLTENEWARVPTPWLVNLHRSGRLEGHAA